MLEPDEYNFWWRSQVSGECLLYTGFLDPKGYGRTYFRGKPWVAHRLALFLSRGLLNTKSHVLHSCDVPNCINPNHLREGTNLENVRDAQARDRNSKGERHGRSKLTAEEVKQIRSLTGWGYKSTAKLYGVKWRAIQKIRKGERW
jgi:hypothetical protein